MTRPPHIVLANDAKLIYSDDYLDGWRWGFETIGCKVSVFDISELRKGLRNGVGRGPLSMGRNMAAKPIADMVANAKPDLVFAHHGRAASNKAFQERLRARGIKTACYLCDEPYETGETAIYSQSFDLVFTMDPCTVGVHRRSRKSRTGVFYLPPGVHTDHFKPRPYFDKPGEQIREIVTLFIGNGTLVPRPRYFEPVDRLVAGSCFHYLRRTVSKVHKKDWIPYSMHPKWYANCRVGLNVHRAPWITEQCYKERILQRPHDAPVPAGLKLQRGAPSQGWGTGFWNDGNLPAAHVNPRFLEMAACGTLVVSDNHRSELARLFPGVPQASNPDRFLELVLYYLDHPEEAEAIGRKCSDLISLRHSYRHRAAEVLIRAGLKDALPAERFSSLGEPRVWLTPQDLKPPEISSSSEPTGPSEPWSPRFGMSWTRMSGTPSEMESVDAPPPWLL